MRLVDSADARPVHFVGIAGAGMSALAELLVRRGVVVTGSDANPTGAPDLATLGIRVAAHDAALVSGARAVVHSSAVPAGHPELVEARRRGIPLIRRAEALAEAVRGGPLVGIAGTHGKTTTTVMTTMALEASGRDPTGVVGGRVAQWGGNLRLGGSTHVVEADEYDRSFLTLDCEVAVVLNVEADHLDIYRDLDDILDAFTQFVAPARHVVRCADDAGAMAVRLPAGCDERTYAVAGAAGGRSARLVAREVEVQGGGMRFRVVADDVDAGAVQLAVPGLHNVRNALAALGAGLALGCPVSAMAPGLAAFTGVERRFQRLGTARGVAVVDDYAHHPTEVAATVAAARAAFPGRRLLVAFQPHLYSRTRDLHREFAEALRAADGVFLVDIYGAREAPVPGITAALIGDRIGAPTLQWQGARTDAAAALAAAVRDGDVVVTMGAGDITRTGPELLARLDA